VFIIYSLLYKFVYFYLTLIVLSTEFNLYTIRLNIKSVYIQSEKCVNISYFSSNSSFSLKKHQNFGLCNLPWFGVFLVVCVCVCVRVWRLREGESRG
jgi:hypothetical protein